MFLARIRRSSDGSGTWAEARTFCYCRIPLSRKYCPAVHEPRTTQASREANEPHTVLPRFQSVSGGRRTIARRTPHSRPRGRDSVGPGTSSPGVRFALSLLFSAFMGMSWVGCRSHSNESAQTDDGGPGPTRGQTPVGTNGDAGAGTDASAPAADVGSSSVADTGSTSAADTAPDVATAPPDVAIAPACDDARPCPVCLKCQKGACVPANERELCGPSACGPQQGGLSYTLVARVCRDGVCSAPTVVKDCREESICKQNNLGSVVFFATCERVSATPLTYGCVLSDPPKRYLQCDLPYGCKPGDGGVLGCGR
jgi:hypothetical protein